MDKTVQFTKLPANKSSKPPILLITLLLVSFGLVLGYFISKQTFVQKLIPTKPSATACTMDAKVCPDGSSVGRVGPKCEFAPCPQKTSSLRTYTNTQFAFSFDYPNDWYGPEIVGDTSYSRIEIGSDVVFPYGTDPLNRTYTKFNSYSIVVDFQADSTQNKSIYGQFLKMKDGSQISTKRSIQKKIRSVQVGDYSGLEMVSYNSPTSQTEAFYVREVVLFGKSAGVIRIVGNPVNVSSNDKSTLLEEYKNVDQKFQTEFENLVSSLRFP